jgi:hypothetical protein
MEVDLGIGTLLYVPRPDILYYLPQQKSVVFVLKWGS